MRYRPAAMTTAWSHSDADRDGRPGRVMLGLPLADRSPAQDDWVVHAYVQSIVF